MLPSSHLGEKFTCTSVPLNLKSLLFADVVMVSDLYNFGGSMDLAKKGMDRQICIPLFTPSCWKNSLKGVADKVCGSCGLVITLIRIPSGAICDVY